MRPARTNLLGAVAAAIAVAASVVACADPESSTVGEPGTRSVSEYYVDPNTAAAAQARQWEHEGRAEDAELIRDIAEQPLPLWATGDEEQVAGQVSEYVGRAVAAAARPLLVAYNIPNRDCGSYSGGGAPDAEYYRDWIAGLAAGIEGHDATVILEPDAVPHELSGCVEGALRDERYELLGDAVDALKGAGATVYLDAGNPGFISDVDALASALDRSGVRRADGFSLNVANYRTIEENVEFGTALSERLDGVRFVVDTSRNGMGAPPPGDIDGAPSWCNPPGRALGAAPTTDTGLPLVDALLWIKRPGESDGSCRPGEPEAGRWFPEYGLGLAERSLTDRQPVR